MTTQTACHISVRKTKTKQLKQLKYRSQNVVFICKPPPVDKMQTVTAVRCLESKYGQIYIITTRKRTETDMEVYNEYW